MTEQHLTARDPEAFSGMERQSLQNFLSHWGGDTATECPVCKGYGRWHEILNAYGPGKHCNTQCGECLGWGYLRPGHEGYATEFRKLKEEWEPKLHCLGCGSGLGHKTCTVRSDVENPPKDALIYCADGWWPHNYGGTVHRSLNEANVWVVVVYTD